MKTAAYLVILPLALASPALAKDKRPDSQTDQADGQSSNSKSHAAKPKEEAVICRRQQVTGSIRTVRVCKTQSQIDAENAAAQDTLEDLQRQGRIQGSKP